MSCKITYKGKRYDTQEDLEKVLKEEYIYDNLEDIEEQEEVRRIALAAKDAETIRIAIGEDLYITGMPIIYQDRLTNSISNLILKLGEVDELLIKKTVVEARAKQKTLMHLDDTLKKKGTRELTKEAKKLEEEGRTETTIKKVFVDNAENYIKDRKKIVDKYEFLISLLNSKGKEEVLKEFRETGKDKTANKTYEIILKSKDPVNYYAEALTNVKDRIKIAEKSIENVDLLFTFALQKVRTFTLINIKKTKENKEVEDEVEFIDPDLEDFEDGKNTKETFQQDRVYQLNGKDQLTYKVKKKLIGINDATYIGEEIKDGKTQATVVNKSFLGQEAIVSFDIVYEQLTTIHALAYQNYDISNKGKNKFETLMNELREHIPNVPYLKNVIDVLESSEKSEQNAYVTNMSKAPINHQSTYSHESVKINPITQQPIKSFSLSNVPTNAFNNSKILLRDWENKFFSMPFVESINTKDEVTFDKEGLLEYFKRAEDLGEIASDYFKRKQRKLTEEYIKIRGIKPLSGAKELINKQARYPDMELLKELQKVFNDLGMSLSTEAIKILHIRKYYSKGVSINLHGMANQDAGYFKALYNNIFDSNGELKVITRENSNLFTDGYVKAFASFISKFDSSVYASSYRNSENKLLYGFSLPSSFTDRMRDLKTNTKFLKELKEDVFQGRSLVLDEIYDEEKGTLKDNSFRNFFDYFTYDTNKIINSRARARKMEKLSKAGMEQVALNFFFNKGMAPSRQNRSKKLNGKAYSYRNGKLIAPTFADKSKVLGLNSMIYTANLGEEKIMSMDNVLVDLVLEEVVYPEYDRIRTEQLNTNETNRQNVKESSSLFYFIPELNYANDHILYETDDDTGKIARTGTGHISSKVLKDLDTNANVKKYLREITYNHIQKLKDEKLEFWKNSGIVVNNRMRVIDSTYTKTDFTTNPDALAYEFVSNYLISNATFFKLFAGDPAQYYASKEVEKDNRKNKVRTENKVFDYIYGINEDYSNEIEYQKQIKDRTDKVINTTLDNLVKRLAGIVAPRTDIIGEYNEMMNFAVLQDISGEGAVSSNMAFYVKLFGEKLAKKYYGNMDRTDAMGYSTFSEWLNIEFQRGSINETEYKKLLKEDTVDKKLSKESIAKIRQILQLNLINPYKPVYYNNYKDGKAFRTLYVKQSSLPLVEFLTRGTDLDYLRKAMVRDKISNAVFASAVKTGQPKNLLNIFNEKGRIREDIKFTKETEDGKTTEDFVLNAPRQGHGIQLDTPLHKKTITDGSQQRNLILSDMLHIEGFLNPFAEGEKDPRVSGQRMRELLQGKYSEIFKLKSDELKEELEYNEETGEVNLEVLRKILYTEFEQRGTAQGELEYLGLIDVENGKTVFKQPLWTSNLASKIESVLISMVDKRVRKLKISGRSFILASDVGFRPQEIKEGEEGIDYIKENQDNIIFDHDWLKESKGILRPQRTVNGVVYPAEIMIPSIFIDKKGNRIDTRKFKNDDTGFMDKSKIPDELLEMFGYRIPSQSPNSLAYMKVVGFLPSINSELIIAPAEFTAQMGSDFDIDKLFVQYYAYKDTGKGKEIKIERDYPNTNIGEENYKRKGHITSLVNDILDIKFNILRNPNEEVQRKILTPLDNNVFKGLSEEIEEDMRINSTFYSPFSQSSFQEKFLSGVIGNEAIGVFARTSILNSMLMNEGVEHYFMSKKGERKFSMGAYEDGTRRNNIRLNEASLSATDYSNLDNQESNYTKADLVSMLVSSAVDNANEQILGKLNINSETYDYVTGSILSGYDGEFIVGVLNQPIILDYIKGLIKAKDSSISTYYIEDLVVELSEKYGGFIRPITDKEEEKNKKDRRQLFDKKDLPNTGLKVFEYTTKELRSNIKNSNELFNQQGKAKEDFLLKQTAILFDFITAKEYIFSQLTALQEATNIEGVQGFGNSIFYMQEKEKQIRDIENINISNTINLLGQPEIVSQQNLTEARIETLRDQGYVYFAPAKGDALVTYLKPTTIVGSMAVHGLFVGNAMFNSDNTLYPIENTILDRLVNTAYALIKTDYDDINLKARAERKKEALNISKQFLFSGLFSKILHDDIANERKRILISTDSRPSFVQILSNIKEANYNRFMQNPLLKRLEIEVAAKKEVGAIYFDATKDNTQLDFIGNAFMALIEDTTVWYSEGNTSYTGARIAMDLLTHQYITQGVQFRKQFIKYLPISIFEKLGVNESLRKINLNKYNEATIRNFEVQVAQHKPDSNIYTISGTGFNAETETIVLDREDKNYNNVVKAQIKGVTLLFKKTITTGTQVTYKYIPYAGGDSFVEYDFSKSHVDSIDISNDKIEQAKQADIVYNNNRRKRLLTSDIIFEENKGTKEEPNWIQPAGDFTIEKYKEILELFKKAGETWKLRLVSEKNANNEVIIHSTEGFRGIFGFPSDVIFSENLQEGVDYELLDTTTPLLLEGNKVTNDKSKVVPNIDAFQKRFSFDSSSKPERALKNIINKLKRENKDIAKHYLYDLMLDALPAFIKENPDFKILLYDGENGGGNVHIGEKGEISDISFNSRIVNTQREERIIIEEILHALTLTKSVKNSPLFAEMEALRLEAIEYFKKYQPSSYESYLKVEINANNTSAVYSILSNTNISVELLKSNLLSTLARHKKSEAFRAIKDAIKKEGDSLDITALKKRLLEEYKISKKDYATYYPLANTGEFIAGLFVSPAFQESMNEISTKQKLSIIERFINFIVKALQRLSARKVRVHDGNINTLFKRDINEGTILEIGVAKTLLSLKSYKNSIYQAKEKEVIKKDKELSQGATKINVSATNVNTTFGLEVEGVLQFVKNPRPLAKMLRETFSNLDIGIFKDNYIVVSPSNTIVNLENKLLQKEDNTSEPIKYLSENEVTTLENEYKGLLQERDEIMLINDNEEDNEYLQIAESLKKEISLESAEKETGGKVGKDISRFYISKKGEGKTVEQAAEFINKDEVGKYRDMIIDILKEGNITNLRETISKKTRLSEINNRIRQIEQELRQNDTSLDVAFNLEVDSINDIIPARQQRLNVLKSFRISKIENIIQQSRINRNKGIDVKINRAREDFYMNLLDEVKLDRASIEGMQDLYDLSEIAKIHIEEVKTILSRDNITIEEVMYANKVLNNWKDTFDLYFTSNEQQFATDAVENFNPIINEANSLLVDVLEKAKKLTSEKAGFNIIEAIKKTTDVPQLTTYGYDISRVGDPLLSFIHKTNTNQDNQARREINDRIKYFDTLLKKVIPEASKYSNQEDGIFAVFFQKYKDGTSTGDLVQVFTEDFYSQISKKFKGFQKLDSKQREERYAQITEWFSKNTEILDINSLYKDKDGLEAQAYREKMIKLLSKPVYDYLVEQQTKKLEKYNTEREYYIQHLISEYEVSNEFEITQLRPNDSKYKAKENLDVWEAQNSPFIFQEQLKTGKPKELIVGKIKKKIYSSGAQYSMVLPRIKNDRSDKPQLTYFDNNFKTILNNPILKEFYDYYVNTLEELEDFLPSSAKEAMRNNMIPYIEKTFIENITDKGFANIFGIFNDTFSNTIDTLKEMSREDLKDSGNPRTLDYNLFKNHEKEWQEYLEIEYGKYLIEHNDISPDGFWEEKIKKEFVQKINKRKSKDLGKLLKTFMGLSLTYRHKSRIQDTLLSAELILQSTQTEDSTIPHKLEMLEYYLDVFHGKSRKQGEYASNLTVLNSAEKERKKDLEFIISNYQKIIDQAKEDVKNGKITEDTANAKIQNRTARIEEAQKMIDELGGKLTGSRVGDIFLKAFQLKGLGWNVIAGLNNMSFGIVANLVEAADGRVINEKEMYDGMKLVLNSVGRNFTFNKWGGVQGMALKIRNLMDRNDILNEASHELYTNSIKGRIAKTYGFALPFNIQRRTEYINQAPIMVAIYKKTFHTYTDGKTVSLFDAFGKDGQWKSEYGKEPDDLINETNTKILQFIKLAHGNYHPLSAMKAKKTIIGRAVILFRSWFFEAWAQRLGTQVHDDILDIDVKGRYISFHQLSKGQGALHYAGQLTILFKDAILRTFGKRYDYNNADILAVDAANMRKLVRELNIYLNLVAIGITLSLVFRDDDVPENEQYALNLILNSINRTTTEMALYTNPVTLLQMVNNPAPAMSIVKDISNILNAFSYFVIGEDTIKTGRFANESRMWRAWTKAIPGLSSYRNVSTTLQQEYQGFQLSDLIERLREDKAE